MGSSPHDPAAARGARPDHPGFGWRFGRSGLAREIGVSLPTTTPEVEAEVVRRTLEEKPSRGTHWSTRLMAECMGLHHS